MNTLRFARIASGLLALGAALDLSAQVPSNAVVFNANGTYVQSFDDNTALPFNSSIQQTFNLLGWSSSDSTYTSKGGTAYTNGSGLFLYRLNGAPDDRALGALTTSTSGSVFYGLQLFNSTGHVLDSVDISFAVENYFNPNGSSLDLTYVSYGFDNGGLTSGTWNPLTSINKNTGSFSQELDLTWNSGSSLWIRWEDTALSSGTNTQLAIDNFSVTAIPEPSTYALILGVATLGLVGFRRWRAQR